MKKTTEKKAFPASAGGTDVDSRLAQHGALSYLEIAAVDARRSAEFYQEILGWVPRGDEPDQPKFSDQSGRLIGRWVTGRAISREPGLLPFIYVDQIRAVAEKVAASGGGIVKAPYAEGTLLVAVIRDPAGNVIGLWQDRGGTEV
jgi:uncharacterized protein